MEQCYEGSEAEVPGATCVNEVGLGVTSLFNSSAAVFQAYEISCRELPFLEAIFTAYEGDLGGWGDDPEPRETEEESNGWDAFEAESAEDATGETEESESGDAIIYQQSTF